MVFPNIKLLPLTAGIDRIGVGRTEFEAKLS